MLLTDSQCISCYNSEELLTVQFINSNIGMTSYPEYRLIRTIGSGVFGYVFEAEAKKTKERVAIKRVEKVGQQLSRQYEVLRLIQGCQNIVKLKDFFFSKNDKGKLIQNMVFEYIDDNLENLIERTINMKTKIPENDIKNYMYQLLKGLDYIHERNIAHRDLKPENILYSQTGTLKICDFGSSKIIDQNGKNTPYIVSRYYRAPELILSITKYGTEIDIWSTGCILAELFLLRPLFKGKSEGDQIFEILSILGDFSQKQLQEFKKEVSYDTSMFQQFSGNQKADLNELFDMVEDRANFIDLLQKMLCYTPKKRIKAREALKHPFFNDLNRQGKVKFQKLIMSDSNHEEVSKTTEKSKRK